MQKMGDAKLSLQTKAASLMHYFCTGILGVYG